MPFAAMGLRGPVLKETWGHVALAWGAVMDFVGGGMWRFLGVAQKDPFSLYCEFCGSYARNLRVD
jgi:hypothetical protein